MSRYLESLVKSGIILHQRGFSINKMNTHMIGSEICEWVPKSVSNFPWFNFCLWWILWILRILNPWAWNNPWWIDVVKISHNNNNNYLQIPVRRPDVVSKVKLSPFSRARPEGSLFNSYYNRSVGEGVTPFPGSFHFTLDTYLIMLSVKQGGIKYHI